MPNGFAVAEIADRLAVLDHVGNDVEFGMFLIEGLAVRIWARRIELTEIPAEGDKLRIREILPVKNHDKPLAPSGFDANDVGTRYRLGHINACHFSAQRGVKILDL